MTSDSAKARPAFVVEMPRQRDARKRRHAEGQRPAIGLEAAAGAGDALRQVVDVARIERVDRVQPLGRMAGRQPDDPGAVIVHGRRRPGAKAGRLEAAHRREIRFRLISGHSGAHQLR